MLYPLLSALDKEATWKFHFVLTCQGGEGLVTRSGDNCCMIIILLPSRLDGKLSFVEYEAEERPTLIPHKLVM